MNALLTIRPPLSTQADAMAARFREVRDATTHFAARLAREDTVIQTMADVSPTKWHLGHTTWFFEQFVLEAFENRFRPHHERYAYIFNSYYVTVGDRHCRMKRGTLSRPTLDEVSAYRRDIDARVGVLLASADAALLAQVAPVLEVGLHHEQQHLELAHTDIKHVFACNPLYPAYGEPPAPATLPADTLHWLACDGGVVDIGHAGGGFAYDNESPRHRVYLHPFYIADRVVTNGEFLAFVDAGGYRDARHWLSDGWARVQGDPANWSHPFYWQQDDDAWHEFTLGGLVPLDPHGPACHLSYFEADAYARWAGGRLPTEAEWEHAAVTHARDAGSYLDSDRLHPSPAAPAASGTLRQASGEVWQWTRSQYDAYPGYVTPPGALGEYNGKFMCNQFVLRGASCVTQRSHARDTYRNFFPPEARWQFTGLRLARDA